VTAPPELIVVAYPEAGLRVTRTGVAASAAAVDDLAGVLAHAGARLEPLFRVGPARLARGLAVYHRVVAPVENLSGLAAELREQEAVETAYVKPPAAPAVLNDMVPLADEAPSETPDLTSRQGYLDPAPAGVDAHWAWTVPGGDGAGVRIVDVEGAWRFSHEDLMQNQGGVIGGEPTRDVDWRNHGTAVVGEFGGDRTSFGVTGICPEAGVRAVSIFQPDGGTASAAAIRMAADALAAGDIILVELHRSGPGANGIGQDGFIAVEWWPDDYDAIRSATDRGVIVVEAAGNGARDLDDPIYDTPGEGFPPGWSNPFRRAGGRDSGAVVAGAGAPPLGTHGKHWGPDRSRLDFSNWGALVDAQGWGREVTTCGYGDLQGGSVEELWYTDRFSGTSSASPIVVGALGCLQGARRAAGAAPLTPSEARERLRATGSPQQDAPDRPATQRIGSLPDLRQLLSQA
jgi:hypothetical protein